MGSVSAAHQSPTAPPDLDWNWGDSPEPFDAVLEHGGWDEAVRAHAWFDPAADPEHTPPREKGAYKLPHHEVVDGRLRVVWSGVVAAMTIVNGARSGLDIPKAELPQVYDHLAAHYREFDEEPPEFRGQDA